MQVISNKIEVLSHQLNKNLIHDCHEFIHFVHKFVHVTTCRTKPHNSMTISCHQSHYIEVTHDCEYLSYFLPPKKLKKNIMQLFSADATMFLEKN